MNPFTLSRPVALRGPGEVHCSRGRTLPEGLTCWLEQGAIRPVDGLVQVRHRHPKTLAKEVDWVPLDALVRLTLDHSLRMRETLCDLITTVEATGGVRKHLGMFRPVADDDWVDLGDVYVSACEALGRKPKVVRKPRGYGC